MYPRVTFTVEEGHTGDASITVSAASLAGLFDGAQAQIQMKDGAGNWVTMTGIGDSGILDLIWLGGNSASVELPDLGPGEYRVIGGASGVGIGTLLTVSADVDFYDHTTIGGYDAETITGNVIDDNDTVTETTVVTHVNGVAVGGAGTTPIIGAYGTLIIDKDGNYSYTPNPDASGIGQVDEFTYTLLDDDGNTDTATLYVGIDSDGQGLVWGEPGEPATVNMVATDNAGEAGIDSAYLVTSGGPSGNAPNQGIPGNPNPLGGATTQMTSTTFTVDPNDVATIRFVAESPDVGGVLFNDTLTVTISGPNGTTTLNGSGGLLGFSGLGVDEVLSGLQAGTYTVTATYVRPNGVALGGSLTLSYTTQSITHLDEFVVADTDPATGNVLADDTLGSTYTKFLVDDGTGNFIEVANGTTVSGDYGTLTINADGSYSYQPTDLAGSGQVEEFAYRLEHPNGTTADATLSIEVEHGDGPYVPPVAMFSVLSDDFILDEGDGEIPSDWLGEGPDDAEIPAPAESDVEPVATDFLASTEEDLHGTHAV
ncbi:VCBS domain-containing protein [Paracoccus denitrificans]|uniref:BapA/Bap/LapF family large adhesin n=1 Tax=Paracoccus denitrificans TaxID=266 RepID=UPI001E3412F8|nr:BapA/Bap/LapF family large adhesin [Paracoccus denitrificans]UFS65723.1 VCBS domain-containing protein [Paracoccus denitrificans]